jgi:Cu+-exporting ATPase
LSSLILAKVQQEEVLHYAGSVEQQSEHPLARAIVEGAREREVRLSEAKDFDSTTGGGVSGRVEDHAALVGSQDYMQDQDVEDISSLAEKAAQLRQEGNTVMFVAVDGRPAGLLAVADPIRETTPEAIRMLHDMGLAVHILTGDNEQTARAVAKRLDIDHIKAGVKPEEKHDHIRILHDDGNVVAMAGDGINDAPALAEADVGIAMGTGTDVAIESAGVTLVKGDLRGIVKAVRLSRITMRNIRQNLFFALGYNSLGVPVAAGVLVPFFGLSALLNPMIAAAAMSFSSVSVVGNALRLRAVGLN